MTLGAEGAGPHTVPNGAQELHDRTHVYLSSIAPALDSVEALLASWERFRAASVSAADGLPERSTLRSVRIDAYTVQKPPPAVSGAEVDAAVRRLTAKELKALHNEFELTCVDDFVLMPEDSVGTGTAPAAVVAARTVHFADDTDAVDGDEVSGAGAGDVKPVNTAAETFIDMSATSRAMALFESGAVTMDVLRSGCAAPALSEAATASAGSDIAATRTPPVISLEQMPPSSVSNGRAALDSEAAGHGGGAHANAYGPTSASNAARQPSGAEAGCTVELEYTADHWIPSSTRWALQEDSSATITVTSATFAAPPPPPRQEEPHVESATESEAEGEEDESHSFTTFSRMALANATRRMRAESTAATALSNTAVPASEATDGEEGERSVEARAVKPRAGTPPPPRGGAAIPKGAANAPVPPATPTPPAPAPAQPTRNMARERDAFVRMRVRDVLLANRVREADTALLGAAFFAKMDRAWNAAADQTTPLLQRLDDMLCESSALLHTLEVMDHEAYRERVMDPAQYLCVPRYSASCASPDCTTPFSTTVTRVMCGRCGQFFCPKCCSERGLGPDVLCEGKRYSLGWEPLCRVCFAMCYDSQLKVVEERRLMITDRPTSNSISGSNGSGDLTGRGELDEAAGAHPAAAGDLSLKEAILFGAYCDANNCLGDGLPPFYVAHRSANECVAFWDNLTYHFAKSQGTLRRGWQSAGGMAAKMVSSAAQLVSQRKATLR